MALPAIGDAKSYLRIETADEDSLVSQLLARAKGTIQRCIGYPFIAVARTYTDYESERYPGYLRYFATTELQLPGPYLATGPAPIVTDANGTVVDPTTYVLDNREGKIRTAPGAGGAIFASRPYTVTATIGLSAHPDYASELEAVASMAILDFVAHLYQNRNPAAESESDEGGSSVSLTSDAIPPRIRQDLLLLPCTRGLILA